MAMKRLRPKSYTIFLKIPKPNNTLTTILLGTITFFIIIYLNSFFSYLSSPRDTTKPVPLRTQNPKLETLNSFETLVNDDADDPFLPPQNSTRENRIAWFRQKLPRLDILNPQNLSLFHDRVTQFLSQNCSTKFHMTWLTSLHSFGNRQLLTIDSLFKSNPNSCLVIASPSLDTPQGHQTLKPLLDRGFRILPAAPDLHFLAENTPAERWLREIASGTKDPGAIPLSQNLSNLLRLMLLYKYGGIYLDTDVLVLRDLSGLRNCLGAQSINPVSREWTRLNGAVMVFDDHHPLLLEFLEEFAATFDGNRWGHNGPYMVTRVVERFSKDELVGLGFRVLATRAFYPVNWLRIGRVMRRGVNESEVNWDERILKELNGKENYVMHLWYKWSKGYEIQDGSVVARLIADHCVVCYDVSINSVMA